LKTKCANDEKRTAAVYRQNLAKKHCLRHGKAPLSLTGARVTFMPSSSRSRRYFPNLRIKNFEVERAYSLSTAELKRCIWN